MSDTCPEPVRRGDAWSLRWEPCGKTVTRDGLCGIHARKADRRRAEVERDKKRKRLEAHATELAKALTSLGVNAYPLYHHDWLQITGDEAEKLIARLRETKETP